MNITKIRPLISSPDKKNRMLGFQLDESTNGGRIKQELEDTYQELMRLLDIDLIALMGMSKIDLSDRELISLPTIPPNITELYCNNNQLTTLPELPNIRELECHNNQLIGLPKLSHVEYLDCSGNQLLELPNLPKIKELECSDNRLTKLPDLPYVVYLFCTGNQLIKLPDSPSIQELEADDYLLNNK